MLIRKVFIAALILGLICLSGAPVLAGEREGLLGTWTGNVISPETKQPVAAYTMIFTEDGRMVSTVTGDNNEYTYTANLTFRLEKGQIVFGDETGKERHAKYKIEGNKLTLEQDGFTNVFTRQD